MVVRRACFVWESVLISALGAALQALSGAPPVLGAAPPTLPTSARTHWRAAVSGARRVMLRGRLGGCTRAAGETGDHDNCMRRVAARLTGATPVVAERDNNQTDPRGRRLHTRQGQVAEQTRREQGVTPHGFRRVPTAL